MIIIVFISNKGTTMKGSVKLLFEELKELVEKCKREGAIQHLKWSLAKSRKTIDTLRKAEFLNLLD